MRLGSPRLIVALLVITRALSWAEGGAYVYDQLGYAIPSPAPYVTTGVVVLASSGAGPFSFPQDIAADDQGNLWLTDSDDPRVVKLDTAGRLLLEIRHPRLQRPGGLWVRTGDGTILVTDTATATILRFDAAGRYVRDYPPPRAEVLPEDYLYSPTRLAQDARGWLSVIGTGTSGGIILLDTDGTFRGFFGANPAPRDPLRALLRRVISREQREAQRIQVLQPYADIDLDTQGFLVTVTETTSQGQIRRLNPLGVNTYPPYIYGEKSASATADAFVAPSLAFLATDAGGIVTVADRRTGKLYQYGPDGDLLFAWGGTGLIEGTFQGIAGIALDRRRGTLYVLDGSAGVIQAFEPTRFARLVHQGSTLYSEGRYDEALESWMEVRRLDANYPLADRGIAKVLLRVGQSAGRMDYLRAAMERSRAAGDPGGWSDAFQAHRRLWIQRAMPFLVLGVFAIFALVVVLSRRGGGAPPPRLPWMAWRVLAHPFTMMQEIREGSTRVYFLSSSLIVAAAVAARFAQLALTSYPYVRWDPAQINPVAEATRIVLPWLTWCGSNYLVTAVFRGEGSVGRIFAASAHALLPWVLMTLLLTALSHVLSLSEAGVYEGLRVVGLVWCGLLFLLGAGTIHGYGSGATLGTSLLSVAGVAALWAVAVLILGLVGTAAGFVVDLVREVAFRG